jgi:hypothetical protein
MTTSVAVSQTDDDNVIDITANTVNGDLGVLLVAVSSGVAGVPTAPAGWSTAISKQNAGTNQWVVIFWKVLDGTETTVTVGNYTSGNRRIRFLRCTSDQSGSWAVDGTATSAEADAVGSIGSGSITTTKETVLVAVTNWSSSIAAADDTPTYSNSYGNVNYERFRAASAYRAAGTAGTYSTTCTLDPDITRNLAIVHAAFRKGTATTTVTGSQATETTTAYAGTIAVALAGARATETDTANAGARAVTVPGARATETTTPNPGTAVVVVVGSRATETTSAFAGSVSTGGATVTGSRATETTTANPGAITVASPGSRATETTTANAGTIAVALAGARATETDTANAGARAVTVPGARATETTTANPGGRAVALLGGVAIETTTANPGSRSVATIGARSTETTTAAAGLPNATVLGQLAAEVDAVFAGMPIAVVVGARATETDTALAGSVLIPSNDPHGGGVVVVAEPRSSARARHGAGTAVAAGRRPSAHISAPQQSVDTGEE